LRRGNLGQFHGFAGWAINETHGEIVTPEGTGAAAAAAIKRDHLSRASIRLCA